MNTNIANSDAREHPSGFPFVTAGAALAILFVFLGLMWLAVQGTNPLTPPDAKAEPKQNAAAKLDEVKGRNQKALEGVGAKTSLAEAHGALLGKLKGPNDKLPFPTPEPPSASAKDEKKDAKPVPELKKAVD